MIVKFLKLLNHVAMLPHYSRYVTNFFHAITLRKIPGFRDRCQRKLRLFYFLTLFMFAVLLVIGWFYDSALYPIFIWAIAVFFVAGPVHALIEFPEHYECDSSSRNILENTRSIKSNFFMTWLTNGNNYHVEHHMYPAVPLQNLKRIHYALHSEQKHYNLGYFAFYKYYITGKA